MKVHIRKNTEVNLTPDFSDVQTRDYDDDHFFYRSISADFTLPPLSEGQFYTFEEEELARALRDREASGYQRHEIVKNHYNKLMFSGQISIIVRKQKR